MPETYPNDEPEVAAELKQRLHREMERNRELRRALRAFVDYHTTLKGDHATRGPIEAQGRAALG